MFRTEHEFVDWLRTQARGKAHGLVLGIGDDAAVVRLSRGKKLLLKTDMSIEHIHFIRRLHPPRSAGHRALARSLSDVAAMGGVPRFALVGLAISRGTSRAWIEELYAGMIALGRRFGVALIGGDTAVVRGSMVIDVMVAGEVPPGKALLRSGARPGDQVYVSGRLGLSALGLRLLRSGLSRSNRGAPRRSRVTNEAIRAHLYPEPRCALGRFLSQRRLASALIDLSDGLSTDLGYLCEASGVGVRVWADRLPGLGSLNARGPSLPKVEASSWAISRADSLELALHGGEDYELLFTVPRSKASQIPARFQGVPLHHIGETCAAKQMVVVEGTGRVRSLEPGGYDHFRRLLPRDNRHPRGLAR